MNFITKQKFRILLSNADVSSDDERFKSLQIAFRDEMTGYLDNLPDDLEFQTNQSPAPKGFQGLMKLWFIGWKPRAEYCAVKTCCSKLCHERSWLHPKDQEVKNLIGMLESSKAQFKGIKELLFGNQKRRTQRQHFNDGPSVNGRDPVQKQRFDSREAGCYGQKGCCNGVLSFSKKKGKNYIYNEGKASVFSWCLSFGVNPLARLPQVRKHLKLKPVNRQSKQKEEKEEKLHFQGHNDSYQQGEIEPLIIDPMSDHEVQPGQRLWQTQDPSIQHVDPSMQHVDPSMQHQDPSMQHTLVPCMNCQTMQDYWLGQVDTMMEQNQSLSVNVKHLKKQNDELQLQLQQPNHLPTDTSVILGIKSCANELHLRAINSDDIYVADQIKSCLDKLDRQLENFTLSVRNSRKRTRINATDRVSDLTDFGHGVHYNSFDDRNEFEIPNQLNYGYNYDSQITGLSTDMSSMEGHSKEHIEQASQFLRGSPHQRSERYGTPRDSAVEQKAVEGIVEGRGSKFLVRWRGYPLAEDNTWVSRDDPALLRFFGEDTRYMRSVERPVMKFASATAEVQHRGIYRNSVRGRGSQIENDDRVRGSQSESGTSDDDCQSDHDYRHEEKVGDDIDELQSQFRQLHVERPKEEKPKPKPLTDEETACLQDFQKLPPEERGRKLKAFLDSLERK